MISQILDCDDILLKVQFFRKKFKVKGKGLQILNVFARLLLILINNFNTCLEFKPNANNSSKKLGYR